MPLRSLQEIIIAYARHLYEEGRSRSLESSIEYPYNGPAFAFKSNGNGLEIVDNTGKTANHRFFGKPKSNQVQGAFGRFKYWERKIPKVREDAWTSYPDRLQRELEIITKKLLPLAIEILRPAAESYSLLNIDPEGRWNYWTHPPCDLRYRAGTLETGESVPAEIQVKVEEFNDLLCELEKEIIEIREYEHLSATYRVDDDDSGAIAGESGCHKQTTELPTNALNNEQERRSTIQRMQEKPEASKICEDPGPAPQPDRRGGSSKSPKAQPEEDPVAAQRRRAVDDYIAEVLEKTGKRITRTDFWKAARYRTRTEFERWQRNDPRTTRTANERFTRLLQEKPHLK
jgi:hypothetical protein